MSFGVDPWSDRIAAATEDGPRRALLAEVSLWRASRLTDIVAARQSTYAISRLHWLLRDKAAAEREARQLLSLCQTPPRASGEDMQAAKGWLESLGAKAPRVVEARPRRERDSRDRKKPKKKERGPKREAQPSKLTRAVDAGDAGDWSEGLGLARGKKGARADLVRFWLHLGKALADEDAERSRRDLHRLAARVRGQLGGLDEEGDAGAPEPKKKERKERPPKAEAKPERRSEERKPEERKPSPRALAKQRSEDLKAALTAEAVPEVDALVPLLAEWPRQWRAIAAAERWDLDDARFERLLHAVDKAASDDRQIPGGTSAAVRRAAEGNAAFRELLLSGSTAARYGGEGVDVLVDLASAAAEDGWKVDRVLRGPTRKESERHKILGTVGDAMNGLWRVLVRKDEAKAEIWYVAGLPAEGRAGVPMLLLDEHQRVIVLPVDPDLLGWYGSLEAPDAIGWTGDEGDAVREALAAL